MRIIKEEILLKKLSIIIPIYNSEKYLSECLDSIIVSEKDLDIILVDDGSKDKSYVICKEYAKKDNRIKIIHKDNGGVSSARNLGIENATGEYIMFVDSDDILYNKWDLIFDYIKEDDIYYFDMQIKNKVDKNELLKYITGANKEKVYLSGPFSKVFNNKFIKKNNLMFNEELINGEDMIFNINAAIAANSYKVINCQFYYYRQTIGQATKRFDKKIIESDMNFHKILNMIFIKNKIDISIANEIENFCLINAVILILNRISYIDKFKNARNHFDFLLKKPYVDVINNISNYSLLFKLCKLKKYRLIYHYLKLKNKLIILLRTKRKEQFIKI